MRFRRYLLVLLFFIFLFSGFVEAQSVGNSTQEILDNVSSGQKPYAVQLNEEECKILGVFNCLQPKVDYVHENRMPQTKQIADTGVSFWQKIGNFVQGLFNKSADPNTGYGNTYLPQNVGQESVAQDPANTARWLSLESVTDETHDNVKNSYLPYTVIQNTTPQPTRIASSTQQTPGVGNGEGVGVPSASGGSTIDYAKSLVQTGGKACGWSAKSGITKTLSCNTGCSQGGITSYNPIRCINGKVKPDVYLDMERSANSNSWLQCVGFVIAVERSQGRNLGSRNAKDYCSGDVPAGYKRVSGNQAAPGDIGVTVDGDYGHIFIILEKAGSGFMVAEANMNISGGMQSQRTYTASQIDCVLKHN